MTNKAFGDAIGVTDSYASYIRNGHRLPSADMLIEIVTVFKLDAYAAMKAYKEGGEAFGVFVREQVFDKAAEPSSDPGTESATCVA